MPPINAIIESPITDRRRLVMLTVAVAAGFLIIAGIVFWPMARNFFSKQAEIAEMEQRLTQLGYNMGVIPLRSSEITEREQLSRLHDQWKQVQSRLKLFSDYYAESQNAKSVDYLTGVARERTQLQALTASAGLQMPRNMGMPDQVKSDDDATTMLMQLKVVSTIVQLAAEERLGKIVNLEPLPPVVHKAPDTADAYFNEYPVRVEFETRMEPLLRFVRRAATNDYMLALRGLRIEKKVPEGTGSRPSDESNPALRAVLVMDALVLLKEPQRIKAPAQRVQQKVEPKGY